MGADPSTGEPPPSTPRPRSGIASRRFKSALFGRFGRLDLFAVVLAGLAVLAIGAKNHEQAAEERLLNVSYDPTRELYRDLNPRFVAAYQAKTGRRALIVQSHGGSSRQARSVIEGEQAADVVTLGLRSDVTALAKRGLVADGWWKRLPNGAQPYYSTIAFVVRRGNPRGIHDWPDLIRPGVELITPDPKSSGNGKLSVLAAYGAVVLRGGTDADALVYLKAFYEHAPFLEAAARAATTAFAIEKLGDVHVAWENEAIREVAESQGELELVYPPLSILAEPAVAWVDANVSRHNTEALAQAYLEFLFEEATQEIIAKDGYRPANAAVLARHQDRFPKLELFSITRIAASWEDAQERFFAENGIVDGLYRPKPRPAREP
jgi:sulfate/thiosulfate transport system substrate-binding protein